MAPRNTAGQESPSESNPRNLAAILNDGAGNVERWGKEIIDRNITVRFGKDFLDRNVADQWGKARGKGTMNEIVEGWGKGFQDRIRSFVPPSRTAAESIGRVAEGGRYAAALEATSGDGGIVTRIAPTAAGRVGVIRASFSSRLPLARIEPPPAAVATSRTEELTKSESPDREWRNGGAADVGGAGSSGSAGRGAGDADSSAAPPWQMPLREASRKVAELGRAVKGLWKGRKDDVSGAGTGTDGAGAGKQSSSLASLSQFPDAEERQLAAALASGKRATLIQFYARRCRLCRSLSQLTAELARRNADWLNVVPADVENSRWLPEVGHYSIKYVPWYVLLDGRASVFCFCSPPLFNHSCVCLPKQVGYYSIKYVPWYVLLDARGRAFCGALQHQVRAVLRAAGRAGESAGEDRRAVQPQARGEGAGLPGGEHPPLPAAPFRGTGGSVRGAAGGWKGAGAAEVGVVVAAAVGKTGEPYSRKHVVKGLAYLVESIRPYRRPPAAAVSTSAQEGQQGVDKELEVLG
ncbi:unnamed protein product [Closterium sp. Naga37s-1]|nr:unnamed protein product [Closterium sp. Naga37s-1]